jgi:hypothetical protein
VRIRAYRILPVANKPKHYKIPAEEVEFMTKEFNHALHLVDCQEQYQEIGSDLYYGVLLDEVSTGVNPAQGFGRYRVRKQ